MILRSGFGIASVLNRSNCTYIPLLMSAFPVGRPKPAIPLPPNPVTGCRVIYKLRDCKQPLFALLAQATVIFLPKV